MKQAEWTLDSLSFSFYSPEEIRKLAVKELTSLISIEPTLGKGSANGLYDSSLGSLNDREPCRNCNLSYYDCNGHYGRIEFVKPIYHPILFDSLVKLLKGSCFYCHRLCYYQGLYECVYDLGKKDDIKSIKRHHDLDELKSLRSNEKEKLAIKIMSQQHRRMCAFCNKKPLVFTKSRKCEILVHISSKTHQSKDEPENKRIKLDNSHVEKTFNTNYSEMELYGKFTENDVAIAPEIIREHLRLLWIKEHDNLKLIFPILSTHNFECPTDIFFMENMLINPPMNRLPAVMHGDSMTESPETTNMCSVLRAAAALREVCKKSEDITDDQRYQNIREGILELQKRANVCFDANTHREIGSQPGLRQKIDKKEGLFRQNIMGKRVNFACRSVISPDPNIGLNEIGVPVVFLTKLTFPEPMNALNRDFLRQCVLNGPDTYPGAVSYQIDNGAPVTISRISRNREKTAEMLEVVLQQKRTAIVNRHAISGDQLIMNRQPTLHRPSMQAHTIKAILDPYAKTLRMHYSNCKAYNADFDGDEMNGHFMQSIMAQAEAKLLVGVSHQYSTPKDGSPLAGLIQDHVIAGTRLAMRDRFLQRVEYMDLVMFGLRNEYIPPLRVLPPTIMKPQRLWTGKQVISTIIMNSIPAGARLPSVECSEPKKNTLWNISQSEIDIRFSDAELVILDGYVCTGIFDKVHIGPSQKGFCNDMRELYGPQAALQILTCISRVLNRYLIYTGFSTSIRDGFLNKDGNRIRENIMKKIHSVGLTSIATSFKMAQDKIELSRVTDLMERAQFDRSEEFRNKMAEIDVNFKQLSLHYINQLGTACKKNLRDQFPVNNLSFMSNTGAKGGESNVTKIAIGLGAIEIEGKRCPLTLAGRTLPSFKRYDTDPASRGFCASRFSTGLSPQEVFFESMAGRDGLVDTAVKTSSSGYLQRCLIKHMEDVTVCHDSTVRDNMHNIIQFCYGYDGLDVIQSVAISRSDYPDIIRRNLDFYKEKYLRGNNENLDTNDVIKKIIATKSQIAQVSPGEAVGLLAAQSIGEPSTQMTLNTFHNAGQSEMNVTLGIPRMREILMCGSEKINTPSMKVPILPSSLDNGNVALVLKKFNKLQMKDVIRLPLEIRRTDSYEITLKFKKKSSYSSITSLEQKDMIPLIENTFFKALAKALKKFTHASTIEITDAKDDNYDVVLNEAINKDGDDGAVDADMKNDDEVVEDKENDKKEKCDDIDSDLSDIDDVDSNLDPEDEVVEDNSNDEVDSKDEEFEEEPKQKNSKVVEMCPDFFEAYQVHQSSNPQWIKLTVNMKQHKVNLKNLLLSLLETTVIASVDGIEKALVIDKGKYFATEGYNHLELFKYDKVFDLSQFYSNNIVKMAKIYGIEAAISCIEHEVMTVFKSYSIDVSSRHLRLIADFLTFSGSVGAFNRHSMKNHPSPVQRASYETALTVLNEMMIHGNTDFIKSPSSNIMLGQVVSNIGTNAVELYVNRV